MPVYEYEPLDHDCLICDGRIAVLQPASDESLTYCPTCGLPVRRVISTVSIRLRGDATAGKAEDKGFVTYKRAGKGRWEKIAGEGGVDAIVGSDEDIAAVDAEKQQPKVFDLDKEANP